MDKGQCATEFDKASDTTELLQACIAELKRIQDASKYRPSSVKTV